MGQRPKQAVVWNVITTLLLTGVVSAVCFGLLQGASSRMNAEYRNNFMCLFFYQLKISAAVAGSSFSLHIKSFIFSSFVSTWSRGKSVASGLVMNTMRSTLLSFRYTRRSLQ